MCKLETKHLIIKGVVQSVGFRPYVYNLAIKYKLKGFVRNDGSHVTIEISGKKNNIKNFIKYLEKHPPKMAKILSLQIKSLDEYKAYPSFEIKKSSHSNDNTIFISPDISMCNECKAELFDKSNFRYLYPFITCVNCGPRYSIIKKLPYDRATTTMSEFRLCENCKAEYTDPLNRRFHAETIACSNCGPYVWLTDNNGHIQKTKNSIYEAAQKILKGNIVAIKGLGGFHIACSAINDNSVKKLRKRKNRPFKPFAIMIKDIESLKNIANIEQIHINLLNSPEAPIVLCPIKNKNPLSKFVAISQSTIGVMLPYTPLHALLLNYTNIPLIMTSGNLKNEPLISENEEALNKLNKIVDYFLLHNRKIYRKLDDSVMFIYNNTKSKSRNYYIPSFIRRARGFVPSPLKSKIKFKKNILALGGDLKNTFCIAKANKIYVSEYIGDLENPETNDRFKATIFNYIDFFDFKPDLIVCDLHPDYFSSSMAETFAKRFNTKLLKVQHHLSHMAACALENNILQENICGIIFDGTGLGNDKSIWGGEIFAGKFPLPTRYGSIHPFYLPGGEKAIKEPWRVMLSLLFEALSQNLLEKKEVLFFYNKLKAKGIEPFKIKLVEEMILKKFRCVKTSSAGRIFDAVSALLGLCLIKSDEAEAAQILEFNATNSHAALKPWRINIRKLNNIYYLNIVELVARIAREIIKSKLSIETLAKKFHLTLAFNCAILLKQVPYRKIVLSGGCFQNKLFTYYLKAYLEEEHKTVYLHQKFPPNDGGISLGQCAITLCKLQN